MTQTGEITDICFVCNKKFSEKSNLNKNQFTYNGVKLNMCAVCMKEFSKNGGLLTDSDKKLHFLKYEIKLF